MVALLALRTLLLVSRSFFSAGSNCTDISTDIKGRRRDAGAQRFKSSLLCQPGRFLRSSPQTLPATHRPDSQTELRLLEPKHAISVIGIAFPHSAVRTSQTPLLGSADAPPSSRADRAAR